MCTPVPFGKEAEMIDVYQNVLISLDFLLPVSHVTDYNRCINLFLLQNWSVSHTFGQETCRKVLQWNRFQSGMEKMENDLYM